jgi:hypothetical protein
MISIKKFLKIQLLFIIAVAAASLLSAAPSHAAMGEIQGFSFSGFGPGDILGPGESSAPDGNPDAVFSVSITGFGALADFSIRSEDGKSAWDTTPGNNIPGIHVQDGAGKLLTDSSRSLPITPFLLGASFVLTVHDDGSLARGGKFTLTALFVDGSQSSATVEIPPSVKEEPAQSAQVRILSARWSDEAKRDLTGDYEKLAGDGVPDEAIRVVIQGSGKLTGVTVRSIKGDAAEWDTLPGNSAWLVAVTSSEKVLNRKDGSIEADLKGRTTLDLRLTDNGSIKRGRSTFEVNLAFSDGSVVKREVTAAQAGHSGDAFEGSAALLGPGNRDLTGRNEQRAGNGKPDLEAELRVETTGTIVAVKIHTISGASGEWDTIPGNGKWLVVLTGADGAILNRADGSVSIPVSGPSVFHLWFEDNGAFPEAETRAAVTLTYDDGRVLSRQIQSPSSGRPQRDPVQDVQKGQREILLSSPRQASSSDYVDKGERPGRSGKKDWVFELQIKGKGRIESMSLQGTSSTGMAMWDTITGNGFSLLGVSAPGKGLLNRADGTVSFDVPPHNNLTLFVEDDGFLRRRGQKQFKVTVTWSDGTVTETN